MTERRRSARTLLLAAFTVLGCSAVPAADYPDRNITLIVPFAAGGTSDIVARLVGEHMARTLAKRSLSKTTPVLAEPLPAVEAEVARWAPVLKAQGAPAK